MPSASLPAQEPSASHVAADVLEVLLVDDHLMIRRGLQLILTGDGMRVAGFASDAQQAQSLIARRPVDVALISAGLGGDRGSQLASELLAVTPTMAVVLYATSKEPERLARMRASGARGIVLTSSEPSVVLRALRTAAAGGTYFDPATTTVPTRTPLSTLSPREHEVLGMLAEGLTALSIARELHLSPETIRTHIVNARLKLGAKTRVQAVALAVSEPRS
jgi:DNA-binding NarL/FixJ family response regulator